MTKLATSRRFSTTIITKTLPPKETTDMIISTTTTIHDQNHERYYSNNHDHNRHDNRDFHDQSTTITTQKLEGVLILDHGAFSCCRGRQAPTRQGKRRQMYFIDLLTSFLQCACTKKHICPKTFIFIA